MYSSKAATTVNVYHHDPREFARNNKVRRKIAAWKNKFRKAIGKPMGNAHRLQGLNKEDYGPNVADVYQENKIQVLMNIELYLTILFVFVAASTAIGAMFISILMIVTIFTAWFSTITYRLYKHHSKCYYYLLELNAQKCPYCHKSLLDYTRKSIKSH
jgi:hypothetical protein